MTYSIADFGRMIADEVRTKSYAEALGRIVKPGSVVVDIGTGTGIFAMLACRFGAAKVYAIDPNPAIDVAREIARDNGFADRIEFIRDLSQNVDILELTSRVDVIVSDIRGILPYCGPSISAIADARDRWLKPDGVLIPASDTVWLAPVEGDDVYHRYKHPWAENAFGFDMSAGHKVVVNEWRHARAAPDGLLSDPVKIADIDYRTISDPNMRAELDLQVRRAGKLHGYNLWFETELAPGIGYSTSPLDEERIYKSAFFPIEYETNVAEGDQIHLKISANLVDDDYVWRWDTDVRSAAGNVRRKFSQSTFKTMDLPDEINAEATRNPVPGTRNQS